MSTHAPSVLLARAQRDIENALVLGGVLQMSTFGLMIERAELYAFAKVTQTGDDLAYRLPRLKDGGMKVKPRYREEQGGYEIDGPLAEVIARGSRWLSLVGQRSRTLRRVLEDFYGDRGARWGLGPSKTNAGGVGDRAFVLWPMTRTGAAWVEALRAKSALSSTLRPDELLATEWSLQKMSPNEPRKQRLKMCGDQARVLLGSAHACLRDIAWEHEQAALQRRAARGVAA